jgi:aminomethyltransferase
MSGKATTLSALHESAGATMGVVGGWSVPLCFTTQADEQQAIAERAGVADVSHLGRVRVRGDGALELLESLCTADVARQEDDTAQATDYVDASGAVIASGCVLRLEGFWVLTCQAGADESLLAYLESMDVADVKLDNQTAKVGQLRVMGPLAGAILDTFLPMKVSDLPAGAAKVGSMFIAKYIAFRTPGEGPWSIEVMLPNMLLPKGWKYITSQTGDRTVQPIGVESLK